MLLELLTIFIVQNLVLSGCEHQINASQPNTPKCPRDELVAPCRCFASEGRFKVHCNATGQQPDIKRLFGLLKSPDYGITTVSEFVLENSDLTELGEDIFDEVLVNSVFIRGNTKLADFDPDVFMSIEGNKNVSQIVIEDCNINTKERSDNFFKIVKAPIFVKKLELRNNGLTSIPDNAFSRDDLFVPQIKELTISNEPQLNYLGRDAFDSLVHLNELTISHMPNLTKIPSSTFKHGSEFHITNNGLLSANFDKGKLNF